MSDDYEPYQWQVGDPEDWGDSVGVPDIPYMGYLNNDDDDERPPNKNRKTNKAKTLSDEAWRLRNEGRYSEALVLINQAIENNPHHSNHLNRKAIILEDMGEYEEALIFYDKALAVSKSKVISNNKAQCTLSLLRVKNGRYSRDDLKLINEALKILPDDKDNYSFLHMKGSILKELGEPVKGQICYYLADKNFDKVEKIEKQLKRLENPKETFINITGTQFYHYFKPFTEGMTVDLFKEPGNEHDKDAIRVEISGKTVGYVANSPKTLIKGVKSASEIKNTSSTKAEVLFILIEQYIIARLI
jgi:tetratricopeptide (TPR) repeat protein